MHANIKQFNNLVAINLFNKFNPIFHISLLIPLVYEADCNGPPMRTFQDVVIKKIKK